MDANDLKLNFGKVLDLATPEVDARSIITDFCRINLADLDTTLTYHAGLYAYAVAVHEMAKVNEARAKMNREKVEATVADQLLRVKNPETGKYPSATEVGLTMKLDNRYAEATEAFFNAQQIAGRLKAVTAGLEHRRDMLVQLSAKQRKEMDN